MGHGKTPRWNGTGLYPMDLVGRGRCVLRGKHGRKCSLFPKKQKLQLPNNLKRSTCTLHLRGGGVGQQNILLT